MFPPRRTSSTVYKNVLQSVVIDWICYLYAHKDQFAGYHKHSKEPRSTIPLILGAHALKVTVVWYICLCESLCVWFDFQTVRNWPRRSTDRFSTAVAWFLTWVFHKTASVLRYRIRVAVVLAHWLTLLLQVPERISIHMTLLSTTWCFCYGLCHSVWCDAI